MCMPNHILITSTCILCTWYDSIDSESDIEYGDEEFIGERVQDTTEVGRLTLEVTSNVPIYLEQ
jgi:hypothetical protein